MSSQAESDTNKTEEQLDTAPATSVKEKPEDSKYDEFEPDYDNLMFTSFDPLKEALAFLMNKMKDQAQKIKDLEDGQKGKDGDGADSDTIKQLEKDLQALKDENSDYGDRIKKRKNLLISLSSGKR